jgi:hypothetical protein
MYNAAICPRNEMAAARKLSSLPNLQDPTRQKAKMYYASDKHLSDGLQRVASSGMKHLAVQY